MAVVRHSSSVRHLNKGRHMILGYSYVSISCVFIISLTGFLGLHSQCATRDALFSLGAPVAYAALFTTTLSALHFIVCNFCSVHS